MSRSNLDKPFYVDVGTSIVAVRCASNHDVILEYDHGRSPQSQPTIQMAKDICDRMNKEVEIHNRSGDCAKLREALVRFIGDCKNLDQDLEEQVDGHYSLIPKYLDIMHDFRDRIKDAEAALAEPARECDVGTVEEQTDRFHAYCEVHKDSDAECLYCPLFGKTGGHCELVWAQMPYGSEAAK